MNKPVPEPPRPEQELQMAPESGTIGEYWYFLKSSRKWWLAPFVVVFLLLAVFLVLANTAAAPFIYTLF